VTKPAKNEPQRSYRDEAIDESQLDLPEGTPLAVGWLTQLGKDGSFREEPRWEIELDVSTLHGTLNVESAYRAITGRKPKGAWCVRHLSVVGLASAEYRCVHSPKRKNPQHSSVIAPIDTPDVENHRLWWRAPERIRIGRFCGDTAIA